MKNKLFLISLILALMSGIKSTEAQQWPQPGAQWTYCVDLYGGPAGYNQMAYTRDTTINAHTYQVIEHLEEHPGWKLYTRFSNDTIYRWVNGEEYLYFSYNLEVGDVYTTYRTAGASNNWADTSCSSTLPLKVIDMQMVEYGDMTLEQWTLSDTAYTDLYNMTNEDFIYTFIERIGVLNSYPFINYTEPPEDCEIFSEAEYKLGDYEDDTFYHHFQNCEGTGIEELPEEHQIKVAPNPAKDWTTFEYQLSSEESQGVITLVNTEGKTVKTLRLQGKQGQKLVDTRHMKAGAYFYTFKTEGVIKTGKLIIAN